MNGLLYDFEQRDIVMTNDGSRFVEADIDSQNCALIAMSQVCRLTAPHVGASLVSRLINRKRRSVQADIAEAERMVKADGGKNVQIILTDTGQIQFKADYED